MTASPHPTSAALPTFRLLPGEVLITTGRPRSQSWQRLFWPEGLMLIIFVVTAPVAILSWWKS